MSSDSGDEEWRASFVGLAFHRRTLASIQEEVQHDASEAGAKFSLLDLLCIGVGSTIGSGVFILIGDVVPIAGPSALLSWVLAGLVCLLSAFSYIELCMRLPTSGSCYTFTHHALGELMSVIGALCLTMEYGISGAGVARGWSRLLAKLVGGSDWMFLWYPGVDAKTSEVDLYVDVAAGLVMLVSVAVCRSGVSLGKLVINGFTLMKLVLVAFLVIAGFSAWHINVFESTDVFFPKGFAGTLRGTSALFFGFIGFDEVCCLAGKADKPTYTMPRALAGTLASAACLSMLAQLAFVGMVPATEKVEWPGAFALLGWGWASWLTNIGEVVLLPLVVLLSFLPQPELLGSMAKDGLFPKAFARSDASGTYVWGANVAGAVMIAVAVLVPFAVLWDMISLGVLLGFNLTNTSLIMVRYGNGGQVRAPGLVRWIIGFWATGSIGAYTLMKGVINPALDGHAGPLWARILSGVFLAAAFGLLLVIHRHEEVNEEVDADEGSVEIFRTPGVPFLPGLALVLNFMLMATLSWRDHALLGACILAGVSVYMVNSGFRLAEFTRKDGKWARQESSSDASASDEETSHSVETAAS